MSVAVHLLLACLALVPLYSCAYLCLLTLRSARLPDVPASQRRLRFDIIVPAHNESSGIERTVQSLLALDWFRDRFRVLVVADNCTDDTAARAKRAGAVVWYRDDPSRMGKGYALQFAFERVALEAVADAIVVVDADTDVSPNLLQAFAARIEQGASAIQANHRVRNPNASWRTCLATIAYAAFHEVRSSGRERLGVSCGLRGNGMCFTQALLKAQPFVLNSMAEDLEYGVILGLGGVRVHYAHESSADADIASRASAAESQRQRWERGRYAVARTYAGRLLRAAWREKSGTCLDLAADLLTPPLSHIVMLLMALAIAALLTALWIPSALVWAVLAGALMALLALHVLRGWQVSGLGPRALLALLRVPMYVMWKLWALARNRNNRTWIRTDRD